LKNWSLKAKLLLLTSTLCALSGFVGIVGYFSMGKVAQEYGYIADKTLPKVAIISEMFVHYRGARLYLGVLQSNGLTPEKGKSALESIADFNSKFEKAMQSYIDLGFEPGQKELFENVENNWSNFKKVSSEAVALYITGKPEDYQKMLTLMEVDFPKVTKTFVSDINTLIAFHRKIGEEKIEAAKSTATRGNILSLSVIVFGTAMGLLFGIWFSNAITKLLTRISQDLSDGANEVASASQNISAASSELSSAATQQAAALQETVTAVDEISSMVNKNAENATASRSVSDKSQKAAVDGKGVVDAMINAMDDINQSTAHITIQTEASNKEISEIINVITEISNKTKVINDIVFQTKLLSFNASVEAARAGEHGKGFAVVAEEVGNLAQMSGNAAKEISSLLEGSIQKVQMIIKDSKTKVEQLVIESKEKVETGLSTAKQCGEVLDNMVMNGSELSSRVGEIAVASNEQATGVQEISNAMAQLDQVTQKNASAANNAANTGEILIQQAQNLHKIVQTLVATVLGS